MILLSGKHRIQEVGPSGLGQHHYEEDDWFTNSDDDDDATDNDNINFD
jgi:hypothetical protein